MEINGWDEHAGEGCGGMEGFAVEEQETAAELQCFGMAADAEGGKE